MSIIDEEADDSKILKQLLGKHKSDDPNLRSYTMDSDFLGDALNSLRKNSDGHTFE